MNLEKLKNKLKNLEEKLNLAIDSENYSDAANLRDLIDKVKEDINKIDKRNDLESRFEEIKEKHSDFTPEVFAAGNDFPGLGENIEVFDYEGVFDELRDKARRVIEIMVLNIFNNNESILKDPIIIEKMQDDIDVYADLKFAAEMTRRLFMNGLKDLDNGAQNSRMYEVVGKLQAEMRQNNKMLGEMMKECNKSYRQLKNDMAERLVSKEESEITNIVDMKEMNNTIQQFLEEKKRKRIEEKRNKTESQASKEEDDFSMENSTEPKDSE